MFHVKHYGVLIFQGLQSVLLRPGGTPGAQNGSSGGGLQAIEKGQKGVVLTPLTFLRFLGGVERASP